MEGGSDGLHLVMSRLGWVVQGLGSSHPHHPHLNRLCILWLISLCELDVAMVGGQPSVVYICV